MNEHDMVRKLRQLNNLIRRTIDNSESKKIVDNVTGTNGCIIGYLSEHTESDVYQRDLEKAFGITRSTASKILSLMEKKGLITRIGVPNDARLKKICLTERSLKLSKLMNEEISNTESKLTKGFTKEELDILREYVERMKNNMNS